MDASAHEKMIVPRHQTTQFDAKPNETSADGADPTGFVTPRASTALVIPLNRQYLSPVTAGTALRKKAVVQA